MARQPSGPTRLNRALAWGLTAAGAAWAPGCRGGGGANEGVVVRQVLHGADALKDAPSEALATPARGANGPAQGTPGLVATTLVSDTPQAIYKQAGDSARRQLESQSVRAALSRLDAQMDQEQESSP